MPTIRRRSPWRRCCIPALVLALTSCARSERDVVIGVGYRSAPAVVALAESVVAPIRIVTEVSPEVRSPTGFLAAEVDYAARLAAVPGMVAIVGHQGSREALLSSPIYTEAGLPQVVPTATSRRLHEAGALTFMMAPDDSIEGAFIGQFAAHLGARTVTLFYVLDEYGAGLRDGVQAELARQSIQVLDAVPVEGARGCPPAQADDHYATSVDAALRLGRPDVIVLATRQLEAGCIAARAARQMPGMRFVAGDGLTITQPFLASAGRAADSIYIAAFWHPDRPDSLSRAFVERFRQRAGREPRPGEAMIYDALLLLAEAARASRTRSGVAGYLRSLGHDRPPYQGITGAVVFPGGADRLVMTRLVGGRAELVFP